MKARNAVSVICGLPVNGLHPVFEAGRGLELPLANDSPANKDDTNGTCDSNDDDQSRLTGFGGSDRGGRGFGTAIGWRGLRGVSD